MVSTEEDEALSSLLRFAEELRDLPEAKKVMIHGESVSSRSKRLVERFGRMKIAADKRYNSTVRFQGWED